VIVPYQFSDGRFYHPLPPEMVDRRATFDTKGRNMKSILTTTLIAASLLTSAAYASSANSASTAPASSASTVGSSLAGDGFYFKPYVGADYQYSSYSYKNGGDQDFSDTFSGGDVHIGARVHKYLGFEASYFDTAKGNKSNIDGSGINTSTKFQGESLDAMGYLPLASSKAELIGLVGVNHTKGSISATNGVLAASDAGSKTFAEFGGGAQYWITDNLNARLLERYEDINHDGVNSAWVTSVGVNWQF
jgi:opacity protein-like surface antigen